MQVQKLPALNTKKEPNLIKVSNAKIEGWVPGTYDRGVVAKTAESGKGITLEIPAENFEFNQYDSYAEFVADCGGEEKVLTLINDFKKNASLDSGKVSMRVTTNKDINAVVTAALTSVLNHSFIEDEALTGKEAKDAINELKADAANLSDAELAAKMRLMFGIKAAA